MARKRRHGEGGNLSPFLLLFTFSHSLSISFPFSRLLSIFSFLRHFLGSSFPASLNLCSPVMIVIQQVFHCNQKQSRNFDIYSRVLQTVSSTHIIPPHPIYFRQYLTHMKSQSFTKMLLDCYKTKTKQQIKPLRVLIK